jgi:molybdate transport system substrate-binding protein
VWQTVERRAVYGENVQQAMMFAQSGNAEVALVALSLAVRAGGGYLPVAPELHAPLAQTMVVCTGGRGGARTKEARAFVDFVGGAAGRAALERYGFVVPGASK